MRGEWSINFNVCIKERGQGHEAFNDASGGVLDPVMVVAARRVEIHVEYSQKRRL